MNWNFKALVLSYKTAPVEIREQVSLNEASTRRLLEKSKEMLDLSEVMVVSTCNRTEVYYSSDEDLSQQFISLIGVEKGILGLQEYSSYFQKINVAEDALMHLFRVSMGLESQVVGDIQISNQIKKSYQWSADAGLAGAFLHRLMHTIFFTNKRVVAETSFRDGAASVSYAATEIVVELASAILKPRILVVGLGEMGGDVARNLANTGIEDITICNRTIEKSEAFAQEFGYKVVPFEKVWDAVRYADIIISSIAMEEAFFTKEKLSYVDILSFKYFIDLSMPRSVEAKVEEISGVLTYNIDQINNRANEAIEKRKAAIPHVEMIVKEAIQNFEEWSKEMLVSPTIQKLKNTLEQIRQEEIARFAKQLNDEESQKIDKITKSMMQKIIKLPVLQLKAACKRGEADTLVDVLNNLFNLEMLDEKPSQW